MSSPVTGSQEPSWTIGGAVISGSLETGGGSAVSGELMFVSAGGGAGEVGSAGAGSPLGTIVAFWQRGQVT